MLKSLKLKIQEIKKEELYNTSSHFIGLILSIIGAPISILLRPTYNFTKHMEYYFLCFWTYLGILILIFISFHY